MEGRGDCPLPTEQASVVGHVLVKVTANERGQVLFVKDLYSTLEPEGSREPVLKALRRCLEDRSFPTLGVDPRYKMRRDYYLAFHYFARPSGDEETVAVPGGRRVPLAWLEEMRREKSLLGESLLARSRRREIEGDGWILRTDVPKGVIGDIRSSLEFAERAFDKAFPGAPPVPESAPVTIYVFKDQEKLHRVAAFDNITRVRGQLGGEYSPLDRMIYTYAGTDTPPAVAGGTAAHEATHHFVAQRLYGEERSPPFWVTEGVAVLIECLDPQAPGGLDLSAFRRGKLFKGGWQWKAPAEAHIDLLEASKRRSDLRHLGMLLRGESGMSVHHAYAISWLLVHYLVNHEEGRHMPAFRKWMAGPYGEQGAIAPMADALGISLEGLESEVRRHLERML